MLKENKLLLGSLIFSIGQSSADDPNCINYAIQKLEDYNVAGVLPGNDWTRVDNTGTYYKLLEIDGVKLFNRDDCMQNCEQSWENARMAALTNDAELNGWHKVKKMNNIKDGISEPTWMDAQRLPAIMEGEKPSDKISEKKNSKKKSADDASDDKVAIARDFRSKWFWHGDENLLIGQDNKWWYNGKHFPKVPGYLHGDRKAYNYAAWGIKGLANNRYEEELNHCLCEFRF